MTRHGISHAAATLTCAVASGLLVRQLDVHIPAIAIWLRGVARWFVVQFDLPWGSRTVSQFLLATALAFLWGAAFSMRGCRHRVHGHGERRYRSAGYDSRRSL